MINLKKYSIVLVVIILLNNCSYKSFKKGQKLESYGNYDEAAKYYQKSILLSYNNKKAYLGLADSLYGLAIKKQDENNFDVKYWENAVSTLEISVLIEDENQKKRKEFLFNAYKMLSTIYIQNDLFDSSLQTIEKAEEMNLKDPDLFFNKGYILGKKNEIETDLELLKENKKNEILNYKKCIELDKKYFYAYINLGEIFYHDKRFFEAEDYFKSAAKIKSDTQNYVAEFKLFDIKLSTSNYDECLKILDNINFQKLDKSNKSIYLNKRGLLNLKKENYEEALSDFKKSIENNLFNKDVRINVGILYFNQKKYKKALSEFNSAYEIKKTAELANYIGVCLARLGDYNDSIEYLKEAIKLDKYYKLTYYNLFNIYDKYLYNKEEANKYKKIYEGN